MEPLLALLFGLIIGSFLNVCIYRWPRDLSVVRPRSRCPHCEKTISWYDNIPIVSYLLLTGRCRYCRARISLRYPAVELLTGAAFFYAVYTLGPTVAALKICVLSALLIGLIFSDLEERILPNEFTLSGIAAGLVFSVLTPMPDAAAQTLLWLCGIEVSGVAQSAVESVLGAALPAILLYSIGWAYQRVRHKEGLGFGDVKLIVMTGSFLGLHGALLTLVLGSVAGSIAGLLYIKLAHEDPATYQLPYGSFLGAAALLVGLVGNHLLQF